MLSTPVIVAGGTVVAHLLAASIVVADASNATAPKGTVAELRPSQTKSLASALAVLSANTCPAGTLAEPKWKARVIRKRAIGHLPFRHRLVGGSSKLRPAGNGLAGEVGDCDPLA